MYHRCVGAIERDVNLSCARNKGLACATVHPLFTKDTYQKSKVEYHTTKAKYELRAGTKGGRNA